ncbi:MAG: histidinol-phosphatase HisJ family protein [Planctomycetes bacterium]|nr:histidinol-phosphatase HisJ family protein [Planctomycetota bacterium]
MPLFDQHLHSFHSCDSRADPVEVVEAAIAQELSGLTFTEHFDTHPDDWPTCCYDDEAYSATIQNLRSRFGSKPWIGKGIEVCYQPDRMDEVVAFLRSHRFDLVILSVHYFDGLAIHKREHWVDVDATDGTGRYLQGVLDSARFCRTFHGNSQRLFDVLGHLDLVKRYTQRFLGTVAVAPFGDLMDEILLACLEADLIPEINTSTLRQGLTEPMPGPDTVARYAALGGTMMSLGSDAHVAKAVGADLDGAAAMLRSAGMNRLAVFRDRKRTEVSLA